MLNLRVLPEREHMTCDSTRVFQKLEGAPWEIEPYLKIGGYEAWRKCVEELNAERHRRLK